MADMDLRGMGMTFVGVELGCSLEHGRRAVVGIAGKVGMCVVGFCSPLVSGQVIVFRCQVRAQVALSSIVRHVVKLSFGLRSGFILSSLFRSMVMNSSATRVMSNSVSLVMSPSPCTVMKPYLDETSPC